MRLFAVIPVLDEREAIAAAVRSAVEGPCGGVVVVDGGSRDGTAETARLAGAHVFVERCRGYGRAVMRGVSEARTLGAEAYVVFDGNGSVSRRDLEKVVAPLLEGRVDFCLGVRPPNRLRAMQRLGNRFAVEVLARRFGVRFADVGAVRAVTAEALDGLELDELGYGWPLQLQARVAARGLRTAQVPVDPLARIGRSKVSGTARGRLGASVAFLRVLARECSRGLA